MRFSGEPAVDYRGPTLRVGGGFIRRRTHDPEDRATNAIPPPIVSRPLLLVLARGRHGTELTEQVVGPLRDRCDVRRLGDAADETPAAVVVAERWPTEWSAADRDAVATRFPLSPVVCVFGPWSRSGTRHGSPWPAAARFEPGEARGRVAQVLDGHAAALPGTATIADRLNAQPSPTGGTRA